MTENKYKGVVKEPCLLVPSRQSSVASGQFGLDFQGPKSFELNLKLLNFSPMDTQVCPYRIHNCKPTQDFSEKLDEERVTS